MVQADNRECLRPDGAAACGVQWHDQRSDRYVLFRCHLLNPFLECSDLIIPDLAPSTPLSNLITEATPLPPPDRAKLLENSPNLASAHASAAAEGNTAAPAADDRVDLHFVAFIKSGEDNLWELDGRRKGPLNRGKLPAEEDVLGETAVALGPKKFLEREKETPGGELRFSILALGPSFG